MVKRRLSGQNLFEDALGYFRGGGLEDWLRLQEQGIKFTLAESLMNL
jgi:hypothetical protein